MQNILFEYVMPPTTWVYVSALMTVGIYFKFHRFWSVRNLDLIGLIALSPGLLLVLPDLLRISPGQEEFGYLWLFCVSGFFLVRLLLDPVMVRRPLLEPNLSASGLTFTGVALLVFLIANVVTERTRASGIERVKPAEQIAAGEGSPVEQRDMIRHGPGHPQFYVFASFTNDTIVPADKTNPARVRLTLVRQAVARSTAILGHLAIVIGMVLIGYRHFNNIHMGVATASLYLLLPYTAQVTSHVDHVVPGALLVLAVAAYRRPAVAGIFVGLSAGIIFYPLFLLPLWCGFYWRRGLVRFALGAAATLALLAASLVFTATSVDSYLVQLQQMAGWTAMLPDNVVGFWEYHEPAFRIPVVAAFVALCASLALWPAQKNLGTLLSCSAAVMLATQFWHAQQGGVYLAWYVPLLVLTIFRPNLEDRVAVTAVTDSWLFWLRRR